MDINNFKVVRRLKGGIWYKHRFNSNWNADGIWFWARFGNVSRFTDVIEIEDYIDYSEIPRSTQDVKTYI